MNGPRRLLLGGLIGILIVVMAQALIGILVLPRFAVDIEIPLRAGMRWVAGQPPYLSDAFKEPPGPTLPFLYPPITLPFLAAIDQLPRSPVEIGGVVGLFACAVLACRRLAVPWLWTPLFLVWPPFAEGIVSGNVQIALFAAFVYLFFEPGGDPWSPTPRDLADRSTSGVMIGGLATLPGAVKVPQPHAWLYALRHRPLAAVGGAIVAGIVAAATGILTGFALWSDWLAQLRLANDPAWDVGGIALSRYLPEGIGFAIVVICLVAVLFVPWRSAGAWVGVLSVVGSVSLHTFGLLFLLPAMLIIRREIALIVAILIATYTLQGTWIAIAVCAWTFAASFRWRGLREPTIGTESDAPVGGTLVVRPT